MVFFGLFAGRMSLFSFLVYVFSLILEKEASQHFLGFIAKAELHKPALEQTGSSASWALNGRTQVLVGE